MVEIIVDNFVGILEESIGKYYTVSTLDSGGELTTLCGGNISDVGIYDGEIQIVLEEKSTPEVYTIDKLHSIVKEDNEYTVNYKGGGYLLVAIE